MCAAVKSLCIASLYISLRDEGYFVAIGWRFRQLSMAVGDEFTGGVQWWRQDPVVAKLQRGFITSGFQSQNLTDGAG